MYGELLAVATKKCYFCMILATLIVIGVPRETTAVLSFRI